MWWYVIAFVLGAWCGIFVMALLTMAREHE